MKKIVLMICTVLLIAVLFACTQNANAPVKDNGVDDPQSAVSEQQPETPPSEAPKDPSNAAGSSEQPAADAKIKADSSSVLLKMPTEVRFGETATATLINNSDYEISYGASYSFQYYVNGAWAELKYREGKERAWIAIAYITQPGGEMAFDFVINADEFTVPLGPGEYRIVKDISAENNGDFSSFEITGVFTIK